MTQSVSAGVSPTSATAPLPLGQMLLYGAGQAGAQIVRDSPTVLLPFFMTTMLGVPPWMAGLAILIPKLWIIICDPLMGSISDRKKASWGRAPFLLAGAPLTAICFFLLFFPVPMPSALKTALYMSALYTVMATAYSAYLVPYMALSAELTADTHERTKLLAWRMVFTMVGVVAGVGFAQPLIGWAGGGAKGWITMGAVFALICLVTMLIPVLVAGRGRTAGVVAETEPFWSQMALAWANQPFRTLLASYFIQSVGQATSYAAVALVFIFVLGKVSLLIPFVLLMAVGTILSQPLWVSLSQTLGKRTVFSLSAGAWALLTFSWFLVRIGGPVTLHLPLIGDLTTEQGLALLRAPLIGVLNSGFFLMAQSMLTDAVVLDRVKYGRSSEGALSGVFSAAEKLAYAIGPAIAGVVLSVAGFQASQGGAVVQSVMAIKGVLINYAIIPALFVLASLIVIRGYRLTPADLAPRG